MRIMFVTLNKAELIGCEVTAYRISAFPPSLFEFDDDLATILKDRVIESPGVRSS